MRYVKELGLFEIDFDTEIKKTAQNDLSLIVVPKKCPMGKKICKETISNTFPSTVKKCINYVKIDTPYSTYPGYSKMLYCRCLNSIKFIMED